MKLCYTFKHQGTVTHQGEQPLTRMADVNRWVKQLIRQRPHLQPVRLGLSELLINAVEHGNLGIAYDDKTQLKKELGTAGYEQFLDDRITAAPWGETQVTFVLDERTDHVAMTICDQGPGFDWHTRLHRAEDIAFNDTHGAGLLVALKNFSSLTYQGCGNTVHATVAKT